MLITDRALIAVVLATVAAARSLAASSTFFLAFAFPDSSAAEAKAFCAAAFASPAFLRAAPAVAVSYTHLTLPTKA